MIEINRKDLNIKGEVYQKDVQEILSEYYGKNEQNQYFINNKLARHIKDSYFLIEDEKSTVYKLLQQDQQANQDYEKEQFLIIKIHDEETSQSYLGVLLENDYKEQFKKPLPFKRFLIEQFIVQIKNWNENKDTFITFEHLGDSYNVQYLEPLFKLQNKAAPLEINVQLGKQEFNQNEQIENLLRKISLLRQEKDIIQETQQQQENKLQQYLQTEQQFIEAKQKIYNLEVKIQQLEQFSSELYTENQSQLEQIRQLNETKKSWDSHLSQVFQQNQQLVTKLSKQVNTQSKTNKHLPQKLIPVLLKIDENIYQSKQYQLEENKPLEINLVLKDTDQEFKLLFTDFEPDQTPHDVMNEDFTYKFEYPSGAFRRGDFETLAYAHPFGAEDQLSFVLLDDGNRKTLRYSINGVERPAIRLHGSLSQFYVVVKFDNDNVPIENYIEFKE